MKDTISYDYGANRATNVEFPNLCPRCHVTIKPEKIYAINYRNVKKEHKAAIIYNCPSCYEPFTVIYSVDDYCSPIKLIEFNPESLKTKHFNQEIQKLSPNFCKIYTEANIAEQKRLNEISGIGYRKALEFLIKDYILTKNTKDSEKIKKMQLMQCINNYIDDEDIKALSKCATWMGNDEAHFLKLYSEYDTKEEIKKFIDAIVFFIEKKNVVEEAKNIKSRK